MPKKLLLCFWGVFYFSNVCSFGQDVPAGQNWKNVLKFLIRQSNPSAYLRNFPGERTALNEPRFMGRDCFDFGKVLKDTVIDCVEINIFQAYLCDNDSVYEFHHSMDFDRRQCDPDKLNKTDSNGFPIYWSPENASCRICGVNNSYRTAYDSVSFTRSAEGYGVQSLILNGRVVEERVIYDSFRFRSKINLMDSLVNDTLFYFYLDSRYVNDSLLWRTVDVDTVLVKNLK